MPIARLHPLIARAMVIAAAISLQSAAAIAQAPPLPGIGTYEITWFSINTVTEQPTVAKLLLVVSPTVLADSVQSLLRKPGLGQRSNSAPRACWRITEGQAAMNESAKGASTDWTAIGSDSIAATLWFNVDAGSSLRFNFSGDSIRGRIRSSGWMSGPGGRAAPRLVVDSVAGRRVGDADPVRCLH